MRRLAGGLAATALLLPLTGCGSSKPGYCGDKDALKTDIQKLPDELKSGGVSALQSSLKKLQTDAQNLVSSAKGDFPSETQALSSSVKGLKTSIQALGSSPSPQALVALLPQAQAVASSVQALDNAAKSKCS